jgi:hypothetical protein
VLPPCLQVLRLIGEQSGDVGKVFRLGTGQLAVEADGFLARRLGVVGPIGGVEPGGHRLHREGQPGRYRSGSSSAKRRRISTASSAAATAYPGRPTTGGVPPPQPSLLTSTSYSARRILDEDPLWQSASMHAGLANGRLLQATGLAQAEDQLPLMGRERRRSVRGSQCVHIGQTRLSGTVEGSRRVLPSRVVGVDCDIVDS